MTDFSVYESAWHAILKHQINTFNESEDPPLMKNQSVVLNPPSQTEKLLDAAAFIFAGITLVLAFSNYINLPEQIPIHFNFKGEADNYGPKSTLFMLPGIALAIAFGLFSLSKSPHKFNYTVNITAENAAENYQKARLLVKWLNALTTLLFLLITWEVITTAKGAQSSFGALFWIVVALIVIIPFYFMRQSKPSSAK